jgi:hypothetical protein
MTLTNHLLTGAALAKFLPVSIAIPLAFVSHFALDALPHFGYKTIEERMCHLGIFKIVIMADVIFSVLIALWLLKSKHYFWLVNGLIAYSPDLLWIYRFTVEEKFGKVKPTKGNRFIQFHREIQKYERVWGIGVEIVYGLGMFALIKF